MKKILLFSFILVLTSIAASAQLGRGNGLGKGQLTRTEKIELRQDGFRNQGIRKRARRDGVVTPMERRKIRRAKCEARRERVRSRHNRRRKII
jgi:hypothetical protein